MELEIKKLSELSIYSDLGDNIFFGSKKWFGNTPQSMGFKWKMDVSPRLVSLKLGEGSLGKS